MVPHPSTNSEEIFYGTSGPRRARIMIVGECWGMEEATTHKPYMGQSGQEFTRMLHEAGINRAECFITQVVAERPPNRDMWNFFEPKKTATLPALRGLYPLPNVRKELGRLAEQIRLVQPDLIIAAGNYALWALTDVTGTAAAIDSRTKKSSGILEPTGIGSYRGSMLYSLPEFGSVPLLPILAPDLVLRAWDQRTLVVHDLSSRVPLALSGDWRPEVPARIDAPPTFAVAKARLQAYIYRAERGELILASDIETLRGLITCIGFCAAADYAITIPFIKLLPDGKLDSYWSLDEEVELVTLIRRLFLMSGGKVKLIGQNWLYDSQYIRAFFGVYPKLSYDTMLMQHLMFPNSPKDLGYLSSLYCKYHWYWKDDNKEWHEKEDLKTHLMYNAEDNLRTLEIGLKMIDSLKQMGVDHLWEEEVAKHDLSYRMTQRGFNIDVELRAKMSREVMRQVDLIRSALQLLVPQEWVNDNPKVSAWFSSPAQVGFVLYELIGLKAQTSRKSGNSSTGKEAINDLRKLYPKLGLLFNLLQALRSLAVFQSTFLLAPLDPDLRMRCSFNPGGTETFRWSSSTNSFGRGANMQNLPTGNEDE